MQSKNLERAGAAWTNGVVTILIMLALSVCSTTLISCATTTYQESATYGFDANGNAVPVTPSTTVKNTVFAPPGSRLKGEQASSIRANPDGSWDATLGQSGEFAMSAEILKFLNNMAELYKKSMMPSE